MHEVTEEQRFLFDLQGYVLLPGAIDSELVAALLAAVEASEARDFDESWSDKLPKGGAEHMTKDVNVEHQIRLNGLMRLDPVFDELIAHRAVMPFLNAFMGEPQLVNTWAITKWQGCQAGGWHHGLPIEDYTVRNGVVRSPMVNVITMLTPNRPGDGCLAVLPGSHKMNIELPYERWGRSGLDHPGAVEVTGEPGDVLVFSEAVSHTGTAKTTPGKRTNLQYNHVHLNRGGSAMSSTRNARHFWMPPEIRERFTPERKALTRWMAWSYPDRDVPGTLEASMFTMPE